MTTCQECGEDVGVLAPSDDFCGESCQQAWQARAIRTVPLGNEPKRRDLSTGPVHGELSRVLRDNLERLAYRAERHFGHEG